jgi:hypothetical protein
MNKPAKKPDGMYNGDTPSGLAVMAMPRKIAITGIQMTATTAG